MERLNECFHRAMCLRFGLGVQQDLSASEQLLSQAADLGHRTALALCVSETQRKRAREILRSEASTGNAAAQYWLGESYHSSRKRRVALAIAHYTASAAQSFPPALLMLAEFSVQVEDFKNAILLYERAARLDCVLAHVALSYLYQRKLEIKSLALKSLRCASRLSDQASLRRLALHYADTNHILASAFSIISGGGPVQGLTDVRAR
jgi:TPR repeat protein